MKKFAKILALVLVLAMAMSVMAGCVKEPAASTPSSTTKGDDNKVTVTWYNGSTELKSEQVEKGSKLTAWEPTVEGKTFTGWFKEASLTQAFDFETVINEDTDIFAAFKSDEYVADANEYYLIGTGAGDMKVSNWNHENSMANLMMTKDTTITDKNVYKITITMYAGDRFQICFGGDWNGQQGIGIFAGCEYADGVNPYNNTEYTAADKKYAEVKDAEGNVVFIGGDENKNESIKWNAILAEGQDGVYEFTLTTYPSNMSYNTVEWKLVEKLDAQEVTHDMYIYGTMNEWNNTDKTFKLNASEDGSTFTGFITITADMYADWTIEQSPNKELCAAFKVINHISGSDYGVDGGMGNFFLTEGTYCVQYVKETNMVTVQRLEYYVVGTFKDADGKAVNFCVKLGVTPAMIVENGLATLEFTAYDVTDMSDYNWMVDQNKPGVMAIKVVYGCELGILEWYSDNANGGDNFYLQAGNYIIALNIETGEVTVRQEDPIV